MTQTVRNGAQTIFSPFQQVTQAIIDPVIDAFDGLANLASLRDENERLRAEREELLSRISEAEAALVENDQLRALLALRDQFPDFTLTTAEVIASGDTFDFRFTINRGSNDGIVSGSAVVDDAGALIGFVSDVGEANATIVPIIASGTVVQVSTEGGASGILSGQGTEQEMRLEVYDADQPVPAESVLTTFRHNSNTPNGLNVALLTETATVNVSKIDTNSVVPFVDFARLRFVTVLGVPEELADQPIETDGSTTTTTTVGDDQ